MTETLRLVEAIRRPRLMIRAARLGLADYRRERDLRRLLGATPRPDQALPALIEAEARAEATRQGDDAAYSIVAHVELLIALMAEARLLARPSA
jgi:hypothetical protein